MIFLIATHPSAISWENPLKLDNKETPSAWDPQLIPCIEFHLDKAGDKWHECLMLFGFNITYYA